jgi:pyrimidine-nucleoside phosphorylase/thymidine phosphorylase
MRAVDIIRHKRRGGELSREEIAFVVNGYTQGTIPDYQISAFLMAVSLVGMSETEILSITETMLASGTSLDFSDLPGEKIDKHSTGGVGDKTSLIIAPLAAAAGVVVPMISGRSLGHSGGTLDKLESIPGFDVRLGLDRFHTVVEKAGCAIIGQTEEIAPADKKLYSLRDATATVESIPLIVGSILSKKLAEGIDGLLLDVKVGTGAFMKSEDDARALGNRLISISRRLGIRATGLMTNMDQPLGTHVGNALEVMESVEILRGGGAEDLKQLCLLLTAHMLVLGRVASEIDEGKNRAASLIASGAGLEKLIEMVQLQGGDPKAIESPGRLPTASQRKEVPSPRSGFVSGIETESIGAASMLLGAGRETVEDRVDPAVGLIVHKKISDEVHEGEPLVTIHYNDAIHLAETEHLVTKAYEIVDEAPPAPRLLRAVLNPEVSDS